MFHGVTCWVCNGFVTGFPCHVSVYILFGQTFLRFIRGSSVSIVTRLRSGRPGSIRSRDSDGFLLAIPQWCNSGLLAGWSESRQGLRIILFTTALTPALGSTHPPIPWVPGALFLGVKRSGHEADHSPPSSAEFKNGSNYTSTPQYAFVV